MDQQRNAAQLPSTGPTRQPAWLRTVWLLLALAILGAAYLAWVSISHGPLAGCEPGSACSKVLQSRWAYWLGVPVSVPAALAYLALLATTLLLRRQAPPDEERGTWAAVIALSVILAGAAVWFVGLQVFVIKAFCKFCMGIHACGFAAAALCLKNIPSAVDPETPMWTSGSGKRGIPRSGVVSLVAIGMAGVLVLAGGQMLVQKHRNLVKVFPVSGTNTVSSSGTRSNASFASQMGALSASPNATLIAPRLLSLYGGQHLIRLDDVPMIGPPDAPLVIVSLFDYTCYHCRKLHSILVKGQRQLSNELGIALLPMPMSSECNPYVPKHLPSFSNSCDYVRLSLAVWRAKREVHRQYDDWLFSEQEPPLIEEARQRAAELVGKEPLAFALNDAWIEEQIQAGGQLHRTNSQAAGRYTMPQLIIGRMISVGPLDSVDHFLVLARQYLSLKKK